MTILLAAILGAAWRRWFGSERADWAFRGYRGMQIAAGFAVLAFLQVTRGEAVWRCALDSALAIGFMTLPIAVSRAPFLWVTSRLPLPTTYRLPHPWRPMLQGAEPWAEVLQGACLFALAVLI